MKKLKEEDIDLLERKRIVYELEHPKQATPKKIDIIKEISKDIKVSEDLIKIRHIYPHFGVEKVKIIAHIYKTKEAMKRFEEINKKKKKEEKKVEEKKEKVKKKVKEEKVEEKKDGKEAKKEQEKQ